MVRLSAFVSAALFASTVATAGVASATPIVAIVFTATTGAGATGSSTIAAAAGDVLTLELRLSPGPEGVSSYGISLRFDSDLRNELDVLSVHELRPAGFSFSFTPSAITVQQESSATQEGRLFTFEAATTGAGPVNGTFAVGRITFRVTSAVVSDGPDLQSGLFNAGVDGLFDNAGHDLAPIARFGGAAVAVPEPATALLLSAGLVALARGRRQP